MYQWEKYNWVGDGPGGCDNHCIPHPCGKCNAPELEPNKTQILIVLSRTKSALAALEGQVGSQSDG